jgi:tRNA pseudouridine55 synthase
MGRPRYRKSAMAGILVVDKPLGWSSMDVVRHVRKAAGFVKTGHAGSLDPLATGVVVTCIGNATRHVERIMDLPKVYATKIDLSAFTATDDREGEREEVAVETPPDEAAVRAVLETFVGDIQQVPPQYSAVHVGGKRAYKLARQGQTVQIEPRTVHVESIELVSYEWPMLEILVECGKGTYVRSMARDIGMALGTGGHLASLRRTAVGDYTIDKAVGAARLQLPVGQSDLLPPPPPPGAP